MLLLFPTGVQFPNTSPDLRQHGVTGLALPDAESTWLGEDMEHHRHPCFTFSQQGGGVMGQVTERSPGRMGPRRRWITPR